MNKVTVYFKDSSMKNVYVDDVEKLDKKGVSFILDDSDKLVFHDSDMSTPSEGKIRGMLSRIKNNGKPLVDISKISVIEDSKSMIIPRMDNNNIEREGVENSVYKYKAKILYDNYLICTITAETTTEKDNVDDEGYTVKFNSRKETGYTRPTYIYYDFVRMMVNIARAIVGLPFGE